LCWFQKTSDVKQDHSKQQTEVGRGKTWPSTFKASTTETNNKIFHIVIKQKDCLNTFNHLINLINYQLFIGNTNFFKNNDLACDLFFVHAMYL